MKGLPTPARDNGRAIKAAFGTGRGLLHEGLGIPIAIFMEQGHERDGFVSRGQLDQCGRMPDPAAEALAAGHDGGPWP